MSEWLSLDEQGRFPMNSVGADVISLEQRFPLFQPKRTALGYSDLFKVPTYISRLLLDYAEIPLFPVNVVARPITMRNFGGHEVMLTKREVITPFHPEMGYNISWEDLVAEARREKIRRLRLEAYQKDWAGDYGYRNTDPLALHVETIEWDLKDTDLVEPAPGYTYAFKEDIQRKLEELRLIIHFPGSNFVSRPMQMGLRGANLLLHEYVPVDAALLPQVSRSIREGFTLFVPTDPALVKQIDGQFVKLD